MASRRRPLKKQIAKTQNPVIRMQLQELLNHKGQQHKKGIKRIDDALDSILRQVINRLPTSALHVLMFVFFTIIMFIIFMILECRS